MNYDRRSLIYSGGLNSAVIVVRTPDDNWYQCITKAGVLTIPKHTGDKLLATNVKLKSLDILVSLVTKGKCK